MTNSIWSQWLAITKKVHLVNKALIFFWFQVFFKPKKMTQDHLNWLYLNGIPFYREIDTPFSFEHSSGWTRFLHGNGFSHQIYEDCIDVSSIQVFLKGSFVFELKCKHEFFWIKSPLLGHYKGSHRGSETFGVYGWWPLETMNDVKALPEIISYGLAQIFERSTQVKNKRASISDLTIEF